MNLNSLSDYNRPAYGKSTPLSDRLAAFKDNFQKLLTGKRHQGYDELSSGLLADEQNDDSRHRVGTGSGYQGPVPGYEGQSSADFSGGHVGDASAVLPEQGHVPSQAEEMVLLAGLAKEAAELLWEMVALEDVGDAMFEMREKATDLQAQLRGLIGDYSDGNEEALAVGLEAFDTLNNVLEEQAPPQEAAGAPGAPASSAAFAATSQAQPAAAAAAAPPNLMDPAPPPKASVPADEPPLIEF